MTTNHIVVRNEKKKEYGGTLTLKSLWFGIAPFFQSIFALFLKKYRELRYNNEEFTSEKLAQVCYCLR